MKKSFFVYRKADKKYPIVTDKELPKSVISTKRKYVGKKAKLEALFRMYGYYPVNPDDNVKADVNKWINDNLYHQPRWKDYKRILSEVEMETKTVEESNLFQYTLFVEYDSTNQPSDEVLVYFILNELMGTPQQFYNGIENPIIRLKKEFP